MPIQKKSDKKRKVARCSSGQVECRVRRHYGFLYGKNGMLTDDDLFDKSYTGKTLKEAADKMVNFIKKKSDSVRNEIRVDEDVSVGKDFVSLYTLEGHPIHDYM